jgi:hypothetical protein
MVRPSVVTLALATCLVVPAAARAEVNIGIQIGTPAPPPPPPVVVVPPPAPVVVAPPPVVVASPPAVVVVPGSPVYYAPAAEFNLFVYRGHYYSFHNGAWFHAREHSGPWALVVREHVPQPVLAVPVKYYRLPPGQAKKLEREEHGHGHGHEHGPKGKEHHGD